jgi:hypothetical protein
MLGVIVPLIVTAFVNGSENHDKACPPAVAVIVILVPDDTVVVVVVTAALPLRWEQVF